MSQPQYIAIRTCDRPGYLQRELLSLSRRQGYRPVTVLVLDDTRDARVQQRNQQIVASADRRFDFKAHYLGYTWQADFIAALKRRLPADSLAIQWLLAPRPTGMFTGGRMLNLVILALAGRQLAMFDDDFLLDSARHLGGGDSRKLGWSFDPVRQAPAFESMQECREAGQLWQHDPVDSCLKLLGHRVQDCMVPETPGAKPVLDASQAGIPPERLRLDKDSVILTTVSGQYGVPISPNYFYLFHQTPGENGPVWADPEQYRMLRLGRAVWNVTYGPVISGRAGSTPSGVDNRRLMPPTMPICKGEDTLLCTLVKYLYPNAAHLYLPWAIEHSRSSLPWGQATFGRSHKIGLSKTIWKQIQDMSMQMNPDLSLEDRLKFMSDYWRDWSNQPFAEFREEIRSSHLRGLRWRIRIINESLERVKDTRSQVYADLISGLKQFKADLEMKEGLPALEDYPALQGEQQRLEWLAGAGRDFGHALGAWSRIWYAARDMQLFS